jgi:hypothetical protein
MTLAYITGGQYVPMINAQLLAQVVIGGVREELSLDRLIQSAQEDIVREMRQAMNDELDDTETAAKLAMLFSSKDIRAHRMSNEAGIISAEVENNYSKCEDMNEMKARYKKVSTGFDSEGDTSTDSFSDELSETLTMHYDLSTDEEVSVEQTKRIVQKMKLHL